MADGTGEQLISMIYVRIDPDTGEGEVASAGNIAAIISSSYGFRPLMDGNSPPLTCHIDARCEVSTFRIGSGEAFLAYGPGLISEPDAQSILGAELRGCMQRGDNHPLAAIRRSLADRCVERERGAMSIVRH